MCPRVMQFQYESVIFKRSDACWYVPSRIRIRTLLDSPCLMLALLRVDYMLVKVVH